MNLRLPLIPMILALVVTLFTSTSLFAFDSEEDLRLLEKARKSEAIWCLFSCFQLLCGIPS